MNVRTLPPQPTEAFRRWRRASVAAKRERFRVPLCLVLIVWLILAAAVSVRTLVRPRRHTVFPIFAASAEHWWGNRSLYELYPGLDRFRYPPLFALVVTPFSALGFTTGGILWSWLSMAVLLAGLWLYARDVIPSQWSKQHTALFLLLGALGALRGLWNAQSNALIVGLLLLGTASLARAASGEPAAVAAGCCASSTRQLTLPVRHWSWWLAALLLAVPVCLKLTPFAPVLLLAMHWPRRLAWRLIVVMAGCFLLPFLTRPPGIVHEHYRQWIAHLLESGNIRWIGFRDGWTVWLVLRHWLGFRSGVVSLCEPLDSCVYHWVQLGTAAAILIWSLRQRHRAAHHGLGPRWLIHVTLSMGLAWLMLFGPAVEHATYVFLAPPLIWALLERRAWPQGRGLILASFTLIMVLGWGVVSRLLGPEWPVLLTALPAGTVLFILWLLGYARHYGTMFENKLTPSRSSPFTLRTRSIPCLEASKESIISP